jgi:hypothetical protein
MNFEYLIITINEIDEGMGYFLTIDDGTKLGVFEKEKKFNFDMVEDLIIKSGIRFGICWSTKNKISKKIEAKIKYQISKRKLFTMI